VKTSKPLSCATSTTAPVDFMAAYGEDSYLSAFTCRPPELIATVSAPERSVIMNNCVVITTIDMGNSPFFLTACSETFQKPSMGLKNIRIEMKPTTIFYRN